MPEGPEVKTITDILNREISGYYLRDLKFTSKSRYARDGLNNYQEMISLLPAKIQQVTAKGKKIIFHLVAGNRRVYLMSTLAMEGRWLWHPQNNSDLWLEIFTRTGRVTLRRYLYFDDSRHFGRLDLLLSEKELATKLAAVGPDLLSDEIEETDWLKKLSLPRLSQMTIGKFLLEQKYFSGIGNYLRAEILYAAKISPYRRLGDLSQDDRRLLFRLATQIIREAYHHRGFTLATFWDPHRQKGTFQVKIYDKPTDPLGHRVVKEPMGDRTIHWVPAVQQ